MMLASLVYCALLWQGPPISARIASDPTAWLHAPRVPVHPPTLLVTRPNLPGPEPPFGIGRPPRDPGPFAPPESPWAKVGNSEAHPRLQNLDRAMRKHGVDGSWLREVRYEDGVFYDGPSGEDSEWAVVDYRPGTFRGGSVGMQVWIQMTTGKRFLVKMAVIQSADLLMVRAGFDLTVHNRSVDQTPHGFRVRYTREAVLDYGLSILVTYHRGRPVARFDRAPSR